jgi:16S rRNA (cytidine1402-2'-O)-methyltransferase
MTGRLFVVGTPIGNLEDMSPRAVRVLGEVDAIYCEDTRRTRRLLSAMGVPAPQLLRLDRHTERAVADRVVARLREGETVAVVSDAGMPTISDPGSDLVKVVTGAGLTAEVIPGPCAVSAALAVSGLPASRYGFAGFLPRKGRERREALEAVAGTTTTVVLYEAPSRVATTVADLVATCGPGRELVAARELTKLHEELWRGTLGEAVDWLAVAGGEPRGEWVLILGPPAVVDALPPDDVVLGDAVSAKLARGADRRQAVAEVAAELGVAKRRVYDVALAMKSPG